MQRARNDGNPAVLEARDRHAVELEHIRQQGAFERQQARLNAEIAVAAEDAWGKARLGRAIRAGLTTVAVCALGARYSGALATAA